MLCTTPHLAFHPAGLVEREAAAGHEGGLLADRASRGPGGAHITLRSALPAHPLRHWIAGQERHLPDEMCSQQMIYPSKHKYSPLFLASLTDSS
jgi:hypothetical protein